MSILKRLLELNGLVCSRMDTIRINLDITNYFGIAFTWYGNNTTANIKINKSELEIDGKVY